MDSSIFSSLDAAIAIVPEQFKEESLKNKEIFEKFSPLFDDDMWKQQFESDDKTVYSYYAKSDEGKLMAKGVATFPFKAEKVLNYARKLENRPLYDEHHMEGKIIDKHEDTENKCEFYKFYSKRGNVKLVDPRDFVVASTSFRVGDCIYSMVHSTTHPDYPEVKGVVRADVEFYIWKFEPGEGGKGCRVSRIFRADPKGSLPDFVKDLVIKRSGHELYDMRKSMLD